MADKDLTQKVDDTGPTSAATGKATSANGEKVDAENSERKQKELELIDSISSGVNLLPQKSETEIKQEVRKTRVNFFVVFFLLFISLASVAVIGVRNLSRAQLGDAQEQLQVREQAVVDKTDIIAANDRIIDRVELYQDVQESTYSPKDVLEYWQLLSSEFGEIDEITINEGLDFEFSGTANDLTEVSRLWHLLSVDVRVDSITLSRVSKQENIATYEFDGELNVEYFVTQEKPENIELPLRISDPDGDTGESTLQQSQDDSITDDSSTDIVSPSEEGGRF